jgi:hypothetical protein
MIQKNTFDEKSLLKKMKKYGRKEGGIACTTVQVV